MDLVCYLTRNKKNVDQPDGSWHQQWWWPGFSRTLCVIGGSRWSRSWIGEASIGRGTTATESWTWSDEEHWTGVNSWDVDKTTRRTSFSSCWSRITAWRRCQQAESGAGRQQPAWTSGSLIIVIMLILMLMSVDDQ